MSSVLSPNRVLLSAAGSGKTTLLVRQALERPQRRIAMLTYTLENLEEIRRSFEAHAGAVKSSKAQVVTKGEVSLALAGTGKGWDLGIDGTAFTIERR